MPFEWIRAHCLSMPHVTEQILWGNDLVFKVAGKMFAVIVLEPYKVCLSFKASPEEFAELIERPGIIPAPYSARAKWVALEHPDALTRSELTRMIANSYSLVVAKLPKKRQAELAETRQRKPVAKTAKDRSRE
jgi:predicted DNA-binding protein (MmcQ/YjbR family)